MLTEERFQRILALVEQEKSISVQALVAALGISESTIRRDLTALDQAGRLHKVRGGALANNRVYLTQDAPVSQRQSFYTAEKEQIARYAAALLEPEDFVFLDAGTTTEKMTDFLQERQVTFVTNAVNHAKKLAELGYSVYLLGGELKASTEAVVGGVAVAGLTEYNFTKGFFGTNGVNPVNGFTTPDVREAVLKRTAMAHCKNRYVLCDSSKFRQISSVTFADMNRAQIITTQADPEIYGAYDNITEVCRQ